jgi:hypothetical protein
MTVFFGFQGDRAPGVCGKEGAKDEGEGLEPKSAGGGRVQRGGRVLPVEAAGFGIICLAPFPWHHFLALDARNPFRKLAADSFEDLWMPLVKELGHQREVFSFRGEVFGISGFLFRSGPVIFIALYPFYFILTPQTGHTVHA